MLEHPIISDGDDGDGCCVIVIQLKFVFTSPTFINFSLPNIFLANPLYKRYDDSRLLVDSEFQVLFHFYLFQLSFAVLVHYRFVIYI